VATIFPMFASDIDFVQDLNNVTMLEVFATTEWLTHMGIVNFYVYLILEGEVQMVNEETGRIIVELNYGHYFGEGTIRNGGTERSLQSVQAKTFVQCMVVHSDQLAEVLDRYPNMKHPLQELRQQFLKEGPPKDAGGVDLDALLHRHPSEEILVGGTCDDDALLDEALEVTAARHGGGSPEPRVKRLSTTFGSPKQHRRSSNGGGALFGRSAMESMFGEQRTKRGSIDGPDGPNSALAEYDDYDQADSFNADRRGNRHMFGQSLIEPEQGRTIAMRSDGNDAAWPRTQDASPRMKRANSTQHPTL